MESTDTIFSNIDIDTPITSIIEDEFGRKRIVQNLSSIIKIKSKTNHPCYTIGIYGKWGEGKTSFLNMLEKEFESEKNIIVCRFNPWFFKDQESLLFDFFNTIAGKKSTKKVIDAFKEYAPIVSMGIGRLLDFAFIPGTGEIVNKTTQEFVNNLPTININVQSEKERVNKTIVKSKKHFIILIDDVDRLDKEEVHILFKLIKQNADFSNMTYILSMDLDMVAKSICNKFENGEESAGKRFIEKIVQIPIHLPQIQNKYLQQYFEKRINILFNNLETVNDQIYQQNVKEAKENIKNYLYPLFTTARQINQYLNSLSFSLPIIYREINISDFCLLEALKVFCNKVYDQIKNSKHIFFSYNRDSSHLFLRTLKQKQNKQEEENDKEQKYVQSLSNDVSIEIKQYIDNILFKLLRPYIYDDKSLDIEHNNRLLSVSYFDRYFIYETPDEFISNVEYDDLANRIKYLSIRELTEKFNSLFIIYGDAEFRRIILKLLHNSQILNIDNSVIQNICMAISKMEINEQCITENGIHYGLIDFVYSIVTRFILKRSEFGSLVEDWSMIRESIKMIVDNAPVCFGILFVDEIDNLTYRDVESGCSYYKIIYNIILRFQEEKGIEGFCYIYPLEFSKICEVWMKENRNEYEEFLERIFNNDNFRIEDLISYYYHNKGFNSLIELFGKNRVYGKVKSLEDFPSKKKEINAFIQYIENQT